MKKTCGIILPNQLFEYDLSIYILSDVVYLIEDNRFFTDYPFHKQKLLLHRASMKYYVDYLKNSKLNISSKQTKQTNQTKQINYVDFPDADSEYEKIFAKYQIINIFDPEDKVIAKRLEKLAAKYSTYLNIIPNPLFVETKNDLADYYQSLKSHINFKHDSGFYKWQRTRLNILMDPSDPTKPLFDRLSYDSENRKPFDKLYISDHPAEPPISSSAYLSEATTYVEDNFSKNFGQTDHFIWPTTHSEAKKLFKNFVKNKLCTFGPYEDAVHTDINFGSHSLISSSLNIGLIDLKYMIKYILKKFNKLKRSDQEKQMPNVEGYIRQLIGWRSYVRFMYIYHSEELLTENNFQNHKHLPNSWYEGTTGIKPIDYLISKVKKYAYAHHIERLIFG